MTTKEIKMVDMIVEAYIKVMGEDKWNKLTLKEKHDVVMTIAHDMYNTIC